MAPKEVHFKKNGIPLNNIIPKKIPLKEAKTFISVQGLEIEDLLPLIEVAEDGSVHQIDPKTGDTLTVWTNLEITGWCL